MRRPLNIAVVIVSGIVGAWIGYWLGDAAGWSENAEWPWTFGGGRGAILLAFGMSVLFVIVASAFIVLFQGRGVRQALEFGLPARAKVLSIKKTGEKSATDDGEYEQVHCELEVRPRDGKPYRTRITQFLTVGYLRSLRPGAMVPVRYDPARRASVAIIEPAAPRRK